MKDINLALIKKAKDGDEVAFEQLLINYKNLVNSICRRYYLIGGEQDDLLQEGMIGLFKAVKSFEESKGVNFTTYATTIIERQLINVIKKTNRQKNSPLNNYVELNNQGAIFTNDDKHFFVAKELTTPEAKVLAQENVKDMLLNISNALSPYEKTILEQYLEGFTYTQIAQNLHKSTKSVDNALNRIKNKLKFLNNNGE